MSDVQAKKMWLPEAMGLMQDLRVENEALQARIEELEGYVKELGDECKVHRNKERNLNTIKAEGIRERFHAIKALMDGKGNDPFREGYLYALELFIEYADELEKGEC